LHTENDGKEDVLICHVRRLVALVILICFVGGTLKRGSIAPPSLQSILPLFIAFSRYINSFTSLRDSSHTGERYDNELLVKVFIDPACLALPSGRSRPPPTVHRQV
jgi:hypothetical protein